MFLISFLTLQIGDMKICRNIALRACIALAVVMQCLFEVSEASGSSWMCDNARALGGKKMSEITLPGTHNSHMTSITDYTNYSYDDRNSDEKILVSKLMKVPIALLKSIGPKMVFESGPKYFATVAGWHSTV